MNYYEEAVKELGPCGNDCSRCANYEKGEIVLLSGELINKLDNFENMVEKIKGFMPIFNYYNEFLDILKHFSRGNCRGCRLSNKPTNQCSINTCHKKEKVNFCFECPKYPCEPSTYSESLNVMWRRNNDVMKVDMDGFYKEQKNRCRY